ncbi:unnamed protein product [Effrenium voratum]|nr:unnamed protein product [Effrenium voratum]
MSVQLQILNQHASAVVPRGLRAEIPEELKDHVQAEEYQDLKEQVDGAFQALALAAKRLRPLRLCLYTIQSLILVSIVAIALLDLFFDEDLELAVYVAEAVVVAGGTFGVLLGMALLHRRLASASQTCEQRLQEVLNEKSAQLRLLTLKLNSRPQAWSVPKFGMTVQPDMQEFLALTKARVEDLGTSVGTESTQTDDALERDDAKEGDTKEGDAKDGDAKDGDAEEGDAEEGAEESHESKKRTVVGV